MGKSHLKRINTPKTWHIKRKSMTFITRPNPGSASFVLGMPLGVILRDMLEVAHTSKEVRTLLQGKQVIVDGIARKDPKHIVGFMDTVSFPMLGTHYRMVLTKQGMLTLKPISKDESQTKLLKIKGKTKVKGKIQLNLFDGRNILVDKDSYKVGDTVTYDIGIKKITENLSLAKDMPILLIGGKHIGQTGMITHTSTNFISYTTKDGETVETLKSYAYCVGKHLAKVTISE